MQELDEVRWESEVRDYQVEHSQETWTSRLEKLEKENSQLFIALQRTQTQLKCVQRENASEYPLETYVYFTVFRFHVLHAG